MVILGRILKGRNGRQLQQSYWDMMHQVLSPPIFFPLISLSLLTLFLLNNTYWIFFFVLVCILNSCKAADAEQTSRCIRCLSCTPSDLPVSLPAATQHAHHFMQTQPDHSLPQVKKEDSTLCPHSAGELTLWVMNLCPKMVNSDSLFQSPIDAVEILVVQLPGQSYGGQLNNAFLCTLFLFPCSSPLP